MARNARQRRRAREDAAGRTSNAIIRHPRIPRTISDGMITVVKGSETIGQLGTSATAAAFNWVDLSPLSTSSSGIYGLTQTWLGRQATLFNRYKYVSARLRFVPFVPTTTAGRVVMAFDSDFNDSQPSSVAQVTQYQNSVECPVWREIGINLPSSMQREFVVTSATTTNAAVLPARPGGFVISTDQATVAQSIGSLYLDYTVNFWSRAAFAINA